MVAQRMKRALEANIAEMSELSLVINGFVKLIKPFIPELERVQPQLLSVDELNQARRDTLLDLKAFARACDASMANVAKLFEMKGSFVRMRDLSVMRRSPRPTLSRWRRNPLLRILIADTSRASAPQPLVTTRGTSIRCPSTSRSSKVVRNGQRADRIKVSPRIRPPGACLAGRMPPRNQSGPPKVPKTSLP